MINLGYHLISIIINLIIFHLISLVKVVGDVSCAVVLEINDDEEHNDLQMLNVQVADCLNAGFNVSERT